MVDINSLTTDYLLAQESETVLESFRLEDAQLLGDLLVEQAGKDIETLTAMIYLGERLVYVRAGKDSTKENDFWANRKANVVKHHAHSSMYVRQNYQADEEEYYRLNGLSRLEYAIHGGAFPIYVKSIGFVGVIAVSGLPMEEDHDVTYRSLKSLKETQLNK
jgi:uncharacterized protein (UPF0303 family)